MDNYTIKQLVRIERKLDLILDVIIDGTKYANQIDWIKVAQQLKKINEDKD